MQKQQRCSRAAQIPDMGNDIEADGDGIGDGHPFPGEESN